MSLEDDMRALLSKGTLRTQEAICADLQKRGYEINQSKASRLLRKLGAIKSINRQGEVVYRLTKEPAPLQHSNLLSQLIIDILSNEQLIVVHCHPGSASFVARLLDHQMEKSEIIGTIAGDDTILVIPKSIKRLQKTLDSIKEILN